MRSIDDIAAEYVERAAALDPCYATYAGIAGHDHELADLGADGFAGRAGLDRSTLAALDAAEAPDPREQVARAAMRERLALAVECYDAGDTTSKLNTINSWVQMVREGFDPGRIHMHGNNKSDEEILLAARAGVGHLILDSFDEIERCERLLEAPQDVLIRVTPGIKPSTHDYIQTGQLDSKFGFGLEDGLAAQAIERVLASDKLNLTGLIYKGNAGCANTSGEDDTLSTGTAGSEAIVTAGQKLV